jgi:hypothetical protein
MECASTVNVTAVPGSIVVLAVRVPFEVRVVVRFVVRHQIGQGETVMAGNKVDTCGRPPPIQFVEVRTSGQPEGEIAKTSAATTPVIAHIISEFPVPLGPQRRKNPQLVPPPHWHPKASDELDSARYVPRCVVIDPHFDWGRDRPLRTPWERTIIYEVHVKGFTKKHPEVPADLRGAFLGLSHPTVIDYFKTLGVTAIELMPAQQFVHDMYLEEHGLKNYWGCDTIGFVTPRNEYSTRSGEIGREVREFKEMVKSLHEAGLEVPSGYGLPD